MENEIKINDRFNNSVGENAVERLRNIKLQRQIVNGENLIPSSF
jgi:hypothetical protein